MLANFFTAALFVLFIILVLAAVVVWQVHTFRRLRRIKACFEDHKLREIAGLAPGDWLVQGRAVALNTTSALLSGRPVIGYRLLVEHLMNRGQHGSWRSVFDHAEINDFEVDDGTGRALVRAAGARIIFKQEYRKKSGLFQSIPPSLERLLDHNGIPHKGWLFDETFRWSEYFLEPGEDVSVYGQARHEVDGGRQAAGYRDLPSRWVMGPPEEGPMIIVDMLQREFIKEL